MGFGSVDHKICQMLTFKEKDEVGRNNKKGELVLTVGKVTEYEENGILLNEIPKKWFK